MEFNNLAEPFTHEEKTKSFLYLQEFLLDKMNKNEQFFIGRLSGNETNLCGTVLSGKPIPMKLMNEMLLTAGIYMSSIDDIRQFVKLYCIACNNSSIMSIWSGGMYKQAKPFYDFLFKINPDKKRICAQALEPYYFMNHVDYKYDNIYKNKKVLIITSHKETTIKQLREQRDVYDKPIFDKSSQFHVYKPVQQHCGNNDDQSWTTHLATMQTELKELNDKTHYDIALVSCGGFGMILSEYIYSELKSSVIYVGGCLQLFFGIKGNRWKHDPVICGFVNEKWTSVLDEDKPPSLKGNSKICEGNCYW